CSRPGSGRSPAGASRRYRRAAPDVASLRAPCYPSPMAAAAPLLSPPSPGEVVAMEFARRNASLAAELGVTLDQLAALTAQTATLAAAEQFGWIVHVHLRSVSRPREWSRRRCSRPGSGRSHPEAG